MWFLSLIKSLRVKKPRASSSQENKSFSSLFIQFLAWIKCSCVKKTGNNQFIQEYVIFPLIGWSEIGNYPNQIRTKFFWIFSGSYFYYLNRTRNYRHRTENRSNSKWILQPPIQNSKYPNQTDIRNVHAGSEILDQCDNVEILINLLTKSIKDRPYLTITN